MSPFVVPSIVTGLALLQFFVDRGMRSARWNLLAGHVVITLPYVARTVMASLEIFDWSLVDTARVLGAGPLRAFWRVTLPIIRPGIFAGGIFPHGAQKMLGWFGGYGFRGTMADFTKSGFPPALALLAVMAEFLGPLGLRSALLTRVAALGIAVVMLVAILTVHKQHGFFMNWFGAQEGEGVEFAEAR